MDLEVKEELTVYQIGDGFTTSIRKLQLEIIL